MTPERYAELDKKIEQFDISAEEEVNRKIEYPTEVDYSMARSIFIIGDGGEPLARLAKKVGSTPTELKEWREMAALEQRCEEIEDNES